MGYLLMGNLSLNAVLLSLNAVRSYCVDCRVLGLLQPKIGYRRFPANLLQILSILANCRIGFRRLPLRKEIRQYDQYLHRRRSGYSNYELPLKRKPVELHSVESWTGFGLSAGPSVGPSQMALAAA